MEMVSKVVSSGWSNAFRRVITSVLSVLQSARKFGLFRVVNWYFYCCRDGVDFECLKFRYYGMFCKFIYLGEIGMSKRGRGEEIKYLIVS